MEATDPVPSPLPAPLPGAPTPLGSTPGPDGTHFAVHSPHARALTLMLFVPGGEPAGEIALDPARHRTGGIWHVFVPRVRPGAEYAWRAEGPARGDAFQTFDARAWLLDPWAHGVAGSERWAERPRGARRSVVLDLAYDWSGDRAPGTPLERTVIYETHVRAFTASANSGVRHPGTFAGLTEKARWLRDLGVTAVQLMPVAEFDETLNPRRNPLTGEPLLNMWGYMPLAFAAPRVAYAADATAAGALREFRDMVRALHAEGLEVILDVVFNHTGEPGPGEPPLSWRGLDRAGYYVLDARGRDVDHTGCGHTFACAKPAAAELILHALRFWARDMHVDGFRFDLASTLTRGEHGEALADPPLIARIATDPALAHAKLLAEPWDMGLYHVGRFPHHGRFAELNGRFRDDVRDWLRHHGSGPGALAARLEGSRELYAGRPLGHSVNFLTSHDGFTLADLVSHERKHNESNGERNRDGTNDHRSWNGGAEGPTHDPRVRANRERQVRNAATLLLLSHGALLWLWGDESLRSQGGNNNAWCHDGPAWWLDWDAAARTPAFDAFVRGLWALRRTHPALAPDVRARAMSFPLERAERSAAPLHLVWRLSPASGEDLLLLVNGERDAARFAIEGPPPGRTWHVLADTAAAPPADWTAPERARPLGDANERVLAANSLVLLAAR